MPKPTAKEVDDAFYDWEIAVHEGHHYAHTQEYAERFDDLAERYLADMPEVLARLDEEIKRRRGLRRMLRNIKKRQEVANAKDK